MFMELIWIQKELYLQKKNAQLYGVQNKTEFIQGNVLDEKLLKNIQAEVAILDPDWSAGSNKKEHVADLEMTQPSIKDMFYKVKEHITHNLVLRIPNTFTFDTLSVLLKILYGMIELGLNMLFLQMILWKIKKQMCILQYNVRYYIVISGGLVLK